MDLSNQQIEASFTLFNERENKDKLSGKNILPTDMIDWVLDTGASYHMTSDFNAFTDLFDLVQMVYIHYQMVKL